MRILNLKTTLLRLDLREGVGKESGKPYKFYQMTVLDEDAKVLQLNVSDVCEKSDVFMSFLEQRNVPVKIDVNFSPKGYLITGTVEEVYAM